MKFQSDPIMIFRVPKSLQTGTVQLISKYGNNDNLLGSINLDLKTLTQVEGEIDE